VRSTFPWTVRLVCRFRESVSAWEAGGQDGEIVAGSNASYRMRVRKQSGSVILPLRP
jgi:hypothetical protein